MNGRWALAGILTISMVGLAPPSQAAGLDWEQCTDNALRGLQCATLTVPKDYDNPSAGTFDLAVVRLKATGRKKGSLFFNPGGPGVSALPLAPVIGKALPKKIHKSFDFVTWDPRGVGQSAGLQCDGGEYTLPPTGPVDWNAVLSTMRESQRQANAACQSRHPEVVPYISTNATVRDLDALRTAVGDKKLTYWGTSYGTRIGYVYAHNYPDRIRAMLLTSPVDPDATFGGFMRGATTAADTALGLMFEAYPGSARHYRQSMKYLDQRTIDLRSGEFTRWHVGMVLTDGATDDNDYAGLASFLETVHKATQGSAKARRVLNRMGPWPPTTPMLGGATAFIGCLDYPQRLSATEQDDLARQIRATAPITGYGGAQGLMYCEGVDVTPDPVPVGFTNWKAPMLIIGSTRDALTPYAWTSDMARVFRNSRVVTLVGGTHTSYLSTGSKCIDRYGTDYLVSRKRPAVDVACQAVIL